ncbi:YibE/F family protein [Anaeromicropila populeti]|uniref:Uncharacterized membrane protein n=1 Tax=Anaeromicropila populeti TaxID=37658 RepID=A0A1I6KAY4_9FIRM|nr:YibE/F family protein [Anaeromicropila populeti]SFR88402.1 Uncharacterized membrane protein [Anaeromicropila populeti]
MKKYWESNWKKLIGILLFFALYIGAIIYLNKDNTAAEKEGAYTTYAKAVAEQIVEDNTQIDSQTENIRKGDQKVILKITSGTHKGEKVVVTNYLSAMYSYYLKEGTRVVVRIDTAEDGSFETNVYNYDRTLLIILFIAAFFILLGAMGGKKGLKSVAGLIFTFTSICFIQIPLILKGFSPLFVTMAIIVVTTIVCFIMIDGIQAKTIAAMAGTIGGVAVAGFIAIAVGKLLAITALNSDESEALLLAKYDYTISVKGLLVCGILLSSLGAVMDVAMSIASSINEINARNPALSERELLKSGMNIGRDAMGTMSNTLILAFAGSSLNMMILIYSYKVPFLQLISTDFVSLEILQGISGSIGIVLAVPMTAVISAYVVKRKDRKTSNYG